MICAHVTNIFPPNNQKVQSAKKGGKGNKNNKGNKGGEEEDTLQASVTIPSMCALVRGINVAVCILFDFLFIFCD